MEVAIPFSLLVYENNQESEKIEDMALLSETIMLGLRMKEGIDIDEINQRFDIDLLEMYKEPISKLIERALIIISDNHLRTTHKGLLLLNEVVAEFF